MSKQQLQSPTDTEIPYTSLPFPDETITINIPIQKNISASEIVKTILKNSAVMAASYSYSFLLIIVTYMTSRLKDDQGSSTLYMAGGNLVITILDTCVVISVSSAFILGFFGKSLDKQIQTLPAIQGDTQTTTQLVSLNKQMSSLVKNGIILGTPFTILSMIGMGLAKTFLVKTGQDRDVVNLIETPLLLGCASLPLYLARFCMEKMLLAREQQTFVTVTSLTNLGLLGIGLGYALGFGALGLPAMGITGIFLGMIAENIATLSICASGLRFKKEFKDYNILSSFFTLTRDSEDREQLQQLIKIGVPVILSIVSEWLASTVRNSIAGGIGTNELAAQNYATQLVFLVFLLALAISEATGLQISGAVSQQRDYAKYGLIINTVVNGIITLGVAFKPNLLTDFLNPDASEAVVTLGNDIIPYAAANAFTYSLLLVMKQAVISKTFTWPSVQYNCSVWTGVLSSYLLGFYTNQGIKGVNQGAIIGTVLGTLALLRAYINTFYAPPPKKTRGCFGGVSGFFSGAYRFIKQKVCSDPQPSPSMG